MLTFGIAAVLGGILLVLTLAHAVRVLWLRDQDNRNRLAAWEDYAEETESLLADMERKLQSVERKALFAGREAMRIEYQQELDTAAMRLRKAEAVYRQQQADIATLRSLYVAVCHSHGLDAEAFHDWFLAQQEPVLDEA